MTTQYALSTSNVSLTAATAKTVLEVATSANVPVEWISLDITFNGVTATDVPCRVDICTYAASGTGTAFTPKRLGQAVGTSASTVKINDTVEPSTPTIVSSFYVPQTSGFSYQWPLGRELFQNVSTFMGIRLTSTSTVSAIVNASIEE